MDMASMLLHRAYTLVEAEIPAGEAIEDLVTLAKGDVTSLRSARSRAGGGGLPEQSGTLELIGFEPGLVQVARRRRAALGDLLDRAIASYG